MCTTKDSHGPKLWLVLEEELKRVPSQDEKEDLQKKDEENQNQNVADLALFAVDKRLAKNRIDDEDETIELNFPKMLLVLFQKVDNRLARLLYELSNGNRQQYFQGELVKDCTERNVSPLLEVPEDQCRTDEDSHEITERCVENGCGFVSTHGLGHDDSHVDGDGERRANDQSIGQALR